MRQRAKHVSGFLGASIATLPYIALLALLGRASVRGAPRDLLRSRASTRVRPRAFVWVAAGTLLIVTPYLVRGEWSPAAEVFVAAVGAWAAYQFGTTRSSDQDARFAAGLTAGLVVMATFSVAQLFGFIPAPLALGTAGRASGWLVHPNGWGAAALVPVLLVVILARAPTAWLALLLGVGVIAASGSRTAAVALALGIVAALPFTERSTRWSILATAALFAGLVVTTDNAWLRRFDPRPPAGTNQLHASEDLDAAGWSTVGVSVEPHRWDARLGRVPRRWSIHKTDTPWWSRLQQAVTLQPGERYVTSIEFRTEDGDARPGVHGISPAPTYAFLNVVAKESWSDRAWEGRTEGALRDLVIDVVELADGWQRVSASFEVASDVPVVLRIGPTPDQNEGAGADVTVRAFGLAPAPDHGYVPTYRGGVDARSSLGTLSGRASYWETALDGIAGAPLLGRSGSSFAVLDATSDREYVAGHAHNLALQTLFETGIVGFVGLIAFVFGLILLGGLPFAPLLVAVLAANALDLTFWVPNVGLSLAMAAGWLGRPRSTGTSRSEPRPNEPRPNESHPNEVATA